MSDFFKHFADLTSAALNDYYFQPGIIAFANQLDLRGSGAHAASTLFSNRNSAAKFVELDLDYNASAHLLKRVIPFGARPAVPLSPSASRSEPAAEVA